MVVCLLAWGTGSPVPGPVPTVGPGSSGRPARGLQSTPVYSYRIVHTYPHDSAAFTQGLVYTGSVLYEGTGLYGRSSLRQVDLETGEVLQIRNLPSQYFGEGIAVWDGEIIQLTWREHAAFVYNRDTFTQTGQFSYPTEGWGLTHDGQRLIMSDGTSNLYFRDTRTFSETGRVQVYDGSLPVTRLNELEYIQGQVYANVWLTDRIARIDPLTGQVTAWIDLAGLRPPGADVLNGIAYDAAGDRLFVTGKLWPYLYQIELYLPHTFLLPLVVKGWGGAPPSIPTITPSTMP
jgi:glutamine cyclotransferase